MFLFPVLKIKFTLFDFMIIPENISSNRIASHCLYHLYPVTPIFSRYSRRMYFTTDNLKGFFIQQKNFLPNANSCFCCGNTEAVMQTRVNKIIKYFMLIKILLLNANKSALLFQLYPYNRINIFLYNTIKVDECSFFLLLELLILDHS